MTGRNVSVRVHDLQSLNQSRFECVDQRALNELYWFRPTMRCSAQCGNDMDYVIGLSKYLSTSKLSQK
jgi:hypothetical protein